ncbi:MAG: HD domain-containing protein [Candidatus Nanoarchaeia archaeon]
MKKITRATVNKYYCEKSNTQISRNETNAEHVYSCLKLADYFLTQEEEFRDLDRLKVYELLMYHDDIEIQVGDMTLSNRQGRLEKEQREIESIPILMKKYPFQLAQKFEQLDKEFRYFKSKESQFAHAIDKLDPTIQSLKYKEIFGNKTGFTKENMILWQQSAFEFSPTLMRYYYQLLDYMEEGEHFED